MIHDMTEHVPGFIVVLNGAPRSGKSSIAAAIQEGFEGVWMNLGVDVLAQATPKRFRPGIGLRPGGERPDLEPVVRAMFAALYESAAAHSRLGLNVVMDVGHHDLGTLRDCAKRLRGLPAVFVGVRCPIEVVLDRRSADHEGRQYVKATRDDPVPEPVAKWQREVHVPGVYDLEVDTSLLSPSECAERIRAFLANGVPKAFQELAEE